MGSNGTAAAAPPLPPPQSGGGGLQSAGYAATLLAVLVGLLGFVALIKAMQAFFEKQKKCLGLDQENQIMQEIAEEDEESALHAMYPRVLPRPGAELRGFPAEVIYRLGETVTFHLGKDADVAKAEGSEGGVCVICQGELCEGHVLRRLHACHHSFHQDCVDAWLKMNTFCPICRTTLEVPALPETPANQEPQGSENPPHLETRLELPETKAKSPEIQEIPEVQESPEIQENPGRTEAVVLIAEGASAKAEEVKDENQGMGISTQADHPIDIKVTEQ